MLRSGQQIDRLNQRAFTTSQSLTYFTHLEGWLDPGERAMTEAAMAIVPRPRTLDIGIGAGRTVPLLRAQSESYVGIDMAARLLDSAKATHSGADLRLMDARELDFPDGSFDLVNFSYNGIDAVGFDDRARILSEVARVLVPGGVFAFSSLNRDGPDYREPFRLARPRPGKPLPTEIMRVAAKGMLGFYNRTMIRHHEVERDDMAIANSSAHNYSLLAVFISVPRQAEQLTRHGFDLLRAWGNEGPDPHELDVSRSAPGPIWVHYLARNTKPTVS